MASPDQDQAAANAVDAVQTDVAKDAVSPSVTNVVQTGADIGDLVSQPAFTGILHSGPEVIEETRRGWKTTEFWGVIAAAVASVGPIDIGDKNKLIVTGLAVFYAIARGLAKNGTPNVVSG